MKVKLHKETWDKLKDAMLEELERPGSKQAAGIARIAIRGVTSRTRRGFDVAGLKFTPYSKAYAKKKGRSWANLTETGKLMSEAGFAFEVLSTTGRVVIRVYVPDQYHSGNVDHYTLGVVHNFGQGHAPKREFMGLDKNIIEAIVKFTDEQWRELWRKLRGSLI